MAAKSKQRLSKIENKLLKLDKLEINDLICSICQSILIEPVTLPCFHDFCKNCFNGSIENNALCCPLCRLRIGSWLRTNTKRRNLVNVELWKHIQKKFPREIESKTKGEDVIIPEAEPIVLRLSAPGEIRSEYEAELKRLRQERLQLEEKHLEETELLIQKIQQEEEEAHKKYLEALQRDEMIAKQMEKELKCTIPPKSRKRLSLRSAKPRYSNRKIDGYLKSKPQYTESPLTDDNTTSTDNSTPKVPNKATNGAISPEMVPSYGNMIKNIIEKKNRVIPELWNKENGDKVKETSEETKNIQKRLSSSETEDKTRNVKKKNNMPSLVVSLPLPNNSKLHNKTILNENRKETGSVDSVRHELCYFKPIDEITTTSFDSSKEFPVRVPVVRPTRVHRSSIYEPPPSHTQYIDSLCKLRSLSLANNLPSAFIIAMSSLRVNKKPISKCETTKSKSKKRSSVSPDGFSLVPAKRNHTRSKHATQDHGKHSERNLRRTRSMSITKEENETTPKKANKGRKAASDRKPYLRSDSKKYAKMSVSPFDYSESLNNNKVSLVVKNLSSPLKNTDVKELLNEQLKIEKMIEQENSDLELARKIEAEWNGRRPRRATVKRQMTLNYALRPAKKLKV